MQLAVSSEGAVAFLSDRDDRSDEAPDFALYTATDGDAQLRVGPGASDMPDGWAPSEHGDVSFSDSGARVFFGTAAATEPEVEDDTPEDERVEVDIWNWKDPLLQPMQLVQMEEERERTYEAMLDLSSGDVMQLATPDVPNVDVGADGDGSVALGTSQMPYRQLISWDGRYSDLYVIDLDDGSREMVAEMVRGGGQLSPGERYVTRWDGFEKAWFAVDVETGEEIDLTGAMDVPFHDILDDHPDALRSYGAAGWTENDEAFVVYDQFDIWAIDPTGARAPRNLTEGVGRASDTRYRYVDLDDDDPVVPTDDDVLLSSFHLYTKQAGSYRDRFGGSDEPRMLMEGDARFAGLRKADDADVVTFTRSTFQDFPNIWVTDLEMGSRPGSRTRTHSSPSTSGARPSSSTGRRTTASRSRESSTSLRTSTRRSSTP